MDRDLDIVPTTNESQVGTSIPTPNGATIEHGHNILIRLPSEDIRHIKVDKNIGEKTVALGKFGSFRMAALLGQPYGLTYEVHSDKTLVPLGPKLLEELEETDANNQKIVDAGYAVQPLTGVEIEAMKKAGVHVSDIIKMQIDGHANYELKTEYSKEKYRTRKQAKFAKEITILEPTLFNVANYYFEKEPLKIRDIRVDTLGQLLSFGNIRPGGRFLIVDDIGGLLTAAVLERLGPGNGRACYLTDLDSPPQLGALSLMNFDDSVLSQFTWLNWAAVDEEYVPIRAPIEIAEFKSDGQKERILKRKATIEWADRVRQELHDGEWDGLLLATQLEAHSIVELLSPYLAGSAQIVIYNTSLQVLCEIQSKLRPKPSYLNPTISEAWTRQYQVLPGRTHPMMNMSGGGGFLLHTTFVHNDPSAHSILAGMRQRRKRRKLEKEGQKQEAMEESTASDGLRDDTPSSGEDAPDVNGGSNGQESLL